MGFKEIVLGTFAWIVIFILMLVPLSILTTCKLFVLLVAKLTRKDLIPLDPMDVLLVPGPGDVKSLVNFGILCRVEGEIQLHNFQKLFTEKFLGKDPNTGKFIFERLHCALVTFGGYAFFQRIDQIDINDHIYIKHLNENECLEDLVSEWNSSKFKENSPCWEIIVVELKATNETAVALKIHHAFADGYSLLFIFDKLTDNTSPYLVKDFNESCFQKVNTILEAPCHFGKMGGSPQSNPLACTLVGSTYRWTMAFTRLDLSIIKEIRRKHNVHFAAVLLAIIGGAIRRYLLETKEESELPEFTTMAITLPWPSHPSKQNSSLESEKLCNHWVFGIIRVRMKDDDPVRRLIEADKSLSDYQDVGLHKFMKRIMIPFMWTLPVCALKKMFKKDQGICAGYSSTVGGNNYKLLGYPVSSIHNFLATNDVNPFLPISTFSFSHSNHLDLTFSVNPQHFQDRSALNRVVDKHLPNELNRLAFLSEVSQEGISE